MKERRTLRTAYANPMLRSPRRFAPRLTLSGNPFERSASGEALNLTRRDRAPAVQRRQLDDESSSIAGCMHQRIASQWR